MRTRLGLCEMDHENEVKRVGLCNICFSRVAQGCFIFVFRVGCMGWSNSKDDGVCFIAFSSSYCPIVRSMARICKEICILPASKVLRTGASYLISCWCIGWLNSMNDGACSSHSHILLPVMCVADRELSIVIQTHTFQALDFLAARGFFFMAKTFLGLLAVEPKDIFIAAGAFSAGGVVVSGTSFDGAVSLSEVKISSVVFVGGVGGLGAAAFMPKLSVIFSPSVLCSSLASESSSSSLATSCARST